MKFSGLSKVLEYYKTAKAQGDRMKDDEVINIWTFGNTYLTIDRKFIIQCEILIAYNTQRPLLSPNVKSDRRYRFRFSRSRTAPDRETSFSVRHLKIRQKYIFHRSDVLICRSSWWAARRGQISSSCEHDFYRKWFFSFSDAKYVFSKVYHLIFLQI